MQNSLHLLIKENAPLLVKYKYINDYFKKYLNK